MPCKIEKPAEEREAGPGTRGNNRLVTDSNLNQNSGSESVLVIDAFPL